MGHVNHVGVFHSHPGGHHACIATSEDNHCAILAVCFFDEFYELDVVHQSFFRGQEGEIFRGH